jgi:hypothetical protein
MLASPIRCQSADVVFIRSARGSAPEQQELEVATRFYGLGLKVVTAGTTHNDDLTLTEAVDTNVSLAVVIAANALSQVNERVLLRALPRRPEGSVPLLILGVKPETDPTLLKTWSGGAVVGCRRLESSFHPRYAVGRVAGLTEQLTGLEIPFTRKSTFYFTLAEHSQGQEITKVRDDRQAVPVFIEATLDQHSVFLDSTVSPEGESVAAANQDSAVSAFAQIAPVIMFIKYCAGEQGWHALHHYANLTIDDPPLVEPYGFLSYEGLLAEMEKHNFHTTIAFIPWNYDRSDAKVVSLIRNHPERFSISMHGNNHDHKEFTDYRSTPMDDQVADLRQGLARMEKFQAMTGIPYDKVMIFPHSIAPEKTLEALKTYDYLATANSANVPEGSVKPPGLLFAMRPVTLLFGGFPSFLRHSVAVPIPSYFTAIHKFLDNPLLFYCHHECFESGVDAFNHVADQVNGLEPDTRWRGLGEIVRHFYLVKRREDSNYDVLGFSANIDLENVSGRDSVFYVRKLEGDHPAIASVIVEGHSWPFELENGYVDFKVPIPRGQTRSVTIHYKSPVSSSPVQTQEASIRIYYLRVASEFRDQVLYGNRAGRAIVHFYYDGGQGPLRLVVWILVLLLFCICVGWSIRIIIRRRHPG